MIQTWVERFIYWEHKDWWELQQEQDLVFQVMRREGDEQKMKQCQLLNGQHDMIVNSVSTLVVLDPWWMNWKGGGWRRHCGQWRMGPASSLLGKNSQKIPFSALFSEIGREWVQVQWGCEAGLLRQHHLNWTSQCLLCGGEKWIPGKIVKIVVAQRLCYLLNIPQHCYNVTPLFFLLKSLG